MRCHRGCSQHRHLERCFQTYHFPFLNDRSSEYSSFIWQHTSQLANWKDIESALPSQICALHPSGCLWTHDKNTFRVRSGGIELTNILGDLQNRFSGGQRTGYSPSTGREYRLGLAVTLSIFLLEWGSWGVFVKTQSLNSFDWLNLGG